MVKKEQQYSTLYGPYTSEGRYSIGDQITGEGAVIWKYLDMTDNQVTYVVDIGSGWPTIVKEDQPAGAHD